MHKGAARFLRCVGPKPRIGYAGINKHRLVFLQPIEKRIETIVGLVGFVFCRVRA